MPVIKNEKIIGVIRKIKIIEKIAQKQNPNNLTAKDIIDTTYSECSLHEPLDKIYEEVIKKNTDSIIILKEKDKLVKILDYFDLLELFTNTKFIIENPPILMDGMSKDILTINPDANLIEVSKKLVNNNSNYAVIIKESVPKRIITLKDIGNQIPKGIDLEKTFAQTVMSPRLITMHPGDSMKKAFQTFLQKRFNQIPLIADNTIYGVLTIANTIKIYYQFLKNIRDSKSDYDIKEIK